MRSKRRWYPILIIGVVLLLASSIVGCHQPPIIAEFSVSPPNINAGESATLSWSITEATTVTIDQGIGDVSNSGMQSVSPTTTTTYTLTAINNAGTVNESVEISVISPPIVTVHFVDVGQGDSILVDLGETEILIDGGGKLPGVVEYLSDFVDGALEVMVATHPHADHIGGLIAVLDAFEVDEIWLNGDTSTSETYSQFMSAVNSEGAQVYEARRGDTIEVLELTFSVLHPVNLSGTTNNNSIVLSLSYGQVDFLFTGDTEQEAEASMLTEGIIPDVEILKVGHHGSRTASSIQFLQMVEPECAIYMAGKDNSYGHPHQETIAALTQVGAEIYGTDIYGTIIITADGETYTLHLERQEVVQEQDLFLEIVSRTSPIGKGYTATLHAKTIPGAYCTITVHYKSGPSSASGLHPKEADSEGNVSWSWKVGTRTTSGSWKIVVTASLDGKTVSQITYFTVH